jgi:hypothetical protein
MSRKLFTTVVPAVVLVFAAGSALADGTITSVPNQPVVIHTDHLYTDTNGDGMIQKSEVVPGSQLEKRFDYRDTNHDGVLTKDEYYLP